MKPNLAIDFAVRGPSLPAAGLLLLCVAAVMAALSGTHLWRAFEANERAQDELAHARHTDTVRKHPANAELSPGAKASEKQSQAILRELTVPWQDLLSIVENNPEPNVALIGIDQQPAQGQIRIVAEAKDADAMIAYLKYLQSSVLLREAVLNAHLVESNVPGTPIRFQIAAAWRKP
jgi:hypothetical protein